MKPLPLSICIPTLNEEKLLGGCLENLEGISDEIVVVDSMSTDRTIEIAEAHGAQVLPFKWNGSFPKKRNWALRNHDFKNPWILFLDADEWVTPGFIEELRTVLPTTVHSGFWLKYHNWFQGKRLRFGDEFRKLALFRVGAGEYEAFPEDWWSHLDMEVHEHPVLEGTIGSLQSPIEHHDDRGLEHYHRKHEAYARWEVNRWRWLQNADGSNWENLTRRQKFKYRNLDKWWLASFYFAGSYGIKGGFLDGKPGLKFALLKWRYFTKIRSKIVSAAGDERETLVQANN